MITDLLSYGQRYVDRGWQVIPVRPGQAAPIESDWPLRGRTTHAAVAATWQAYPDANIGIITGAASRFWVFDVDPKNGGDVALAGLVQAYGRLPETYTVSTPHAGVHYYFSLPDFEPRNTVGRDRPGMLPRGLDVRGRGGQVVAPPSVRDGRAYAVLLEASIAQAPEWLIDMIRPPEASASAPSPGVGAPPNLSVAGGVAGSLRAGAYTAQAIAGLWHEMAGARPGTRNETAFRVACRLIELANSAWAGLTLQEAFDAYLSATRAANIDGTFLDAEAYACWTSAQRRIGNAGVDMPPTAYYGSPLALPPNFAIPVEPYAPAMSPTGSPEQAPAPTVTPAGTPAADPTEVAITAEMARLWIRGEAQARLRRREAELSPIEILDEEQADARPMPVPMVEGWLYRGEVARVFGPPGGGKTFVSVDLACHIATGRPWHGCAVTRAGVAYVAAEDPEGVSMRARAWRRHYGFERHGVRLIPNMLQLDAEGAARLARALHAAAIPDLGFVVLDTQALVTVGMDEDSAREMGEFISVIKRLARQLNVAILIVHHSGVAGGRGRGSTAMDAALQAEFETVLAGSTVTLRHKKAKNTAKNQALTFSMHPVALGETNTFGHEITSCVLVAAGDAGTAGAEIVAGGVRIIPARTRRTREEIAVALVIEILRSVYATGVGGTKAEVRTLFVARQEMATISRTQAYEHFGRAWGHLASLGRIGRNATRDAYKFVELPDSDDLAPNPDKLDEHGYIILR